MEQNQGKHFDPHRVWEPVGVNAAVSYNAAEAIARAAQVLKVDTVMMGVSRHGAVYPLLRGHVVNGLTRRLPPSCHLLLHN